MAKRKEKPEPKVFDINNITIIKEKQKNQLLEEAVSFTMDFIKTINFKKSIKTQAIINYFPINDTYGISMIADTDVCNDPFIWFGYTEGPEKDRYAICEMPSYNINEDAIERCLKKLLKKYGY